RAQRTLRGGVRDARPATAIAVWAIDVDDAAPARRDHSRHKGLRQVPGGRQLLIEEEVPVLMRGVKKSLVHSMIKFFVLDVLLRQVVAVSSDPAPDSAFAPPFFGRPSGQLP